MASAGGLTRRRGAGAANATGEHDDEREYAGSPAPTGPAAGASAADRTAATATAASETTYQGGENGHKIAFDPRDISESEERNKQPKLTLMEEVLLMGLKDKQVRCGACACDAFTFLSLPCPFSFPWRRAVRGTGEMAELTRAYGGTGLPFILE